jgi:hypothetical protein
MPDKRKREYPNKDLPSTAISFPRDQLALLKSIAAVDDRSLASLVRHCCKYWLQQSAEGRELSRRAREHSMLKTNLMIAEPVEPPSTPADKDPE